AGAACSACGPPDLSPAATCCARSSRRPPSSDTSVASCPTSRGSVPIVSRSWGAPCDRLRGHPRLRPGPPAGAAAEARCRRPDHRRGPGCHRPAGADGRLDGRRGPPSHPHHGPGNLLVPLPRRVLAQGRHQRPCAVVAFGRARLRRRHASGAGRPGRPGLPPARRHLFRRRRPRRHRPVLQGGGTMTERAAPATSEAYPEQVGGFEGDLLGQVQPDRETFRALAARQRVVPLTLRVLADEDTPVSLYRRVTEGTDGRGTFLLESAGEGESSRWSIIGSRARAILTERDGRARWIGDAPADAPADGDPLEALREVAAAFRAARVPQLPPFTGGLV